MPHILNFELFSKFDAMFNGKQITGNKVGPYPGDRIVVEGREGTTLERGPCILVRILDNPVCFSGCLSTTHVQRFSLFYAPSSEGVELEEGRNLRSAVSPPRTRCHQAQLGMSLGHQHVYQAFFPDESVPRWATPSPSAPFSYRIISFLNFVSFPYERLSLSLFLSPSTLLYDYSRYTRLTQLYLGPYDVSLTLPTPWRDAALRRKASKSRNILFI